MSSLLSDIKKEEGVPISFDQIKKAVGPELAKQSNFCFVDTLPSVVTERTIFNGKKFACCLIGLYSHNRSTSIRHWILLYRHDNGKTVFYDSLGNTIEQLFFKTKNPHKAFLDFVKNKTVSHNVALQKSQHMINTCGYHVAVRITQHRKTPRDYIRWLKGSMMDTDDAVSWLCYLGFHS